MNAESQGPPPASQGPPSAGAPPGATQRTSTGSRAWTIIRIVNVRLRFIALMVVVGLVAANWENLMNHWDRWRRPPKAPEVSAAGPEAKGVHPGEAAGQVEWFCPMHPQIIRSEPGNCPICGMTLSQRVKAAPGPPQAELSPEVLARVELTPQKVYMGRIETAAVEVRPLRREVRTVGLVDYDETRRAVIAARVPGRIDKLLVNYTGQEVAAGQPLALVYSPALLVAQEELLTAARALKAQGDPTAPSAKVVLEAARQKLILWGLSEKQVDEVVARGAPRTDIEILSPIAGIVTERRALEGRYFMEGDELYTVADLGTVWVQAQVFESDLAGVAVGTPVRVASDAWPNETFTGRVSFVAYTADPATRTVAARLEVANPQYRLKPGMFVAATLELPVETVPALPESALVDTGRRKVAYRQSAPGVFEMVEVKTGLRATAVSPPEAQPGPTVSDSSLAGAEFYPVLAGLKVGDLVATRGAFLVDAENRLNPAAAVQYFGATGAPQSGGAAAPGAGQMPPGHQH